MMSTFVLRRIENKFHTFYISEIGAAAAASELKVIHTHTSANFYTKDTTLLGVFIQ